MAGQNIFNSIKLSAPPSSSFDLSHDVKMSFNMGQLVPSLCLECVPGDRFNLGCEALVRFAPMVTPPMHRYDVYQHYFFVPARLLWDNWENFITNTPIGSPTPTIPGFPTVTMGEGFHTPLADYLGIPLPTGDVGAVVEQVNAMPFSAYQFVYNEFYRDQNLHPEIGYKLVDGDNTGTNPELTSLRRRSWEHDYFTGALPFAQKGGSVDIPLAGFQDIPVYRNTPSIAAGTDITVAVGPTPLHIDNAPSEADANVGADELYADTSQLSINNTSITDLRRAFRLQEWLEKAARGGSRYVESILSFFNVKSPDARLQRPEYITGTKSPVVISEVLNTTGTTDAAQGDMAGHGVSVTQGRGAGYFCQEHGYIIGIMSIMPKTAYQQGIARMFLKRDPFDFYFPQFANIGEQAIENREIYAYDPDGAETFGYIPRYAEYKYMNNRVAGDFRTTLNFWHSSRIFDAPPALNGDFIQCVTDDRVFAVPDPEVQKMWVQIVHKIRARRPMQKYGQPSF